MAPDAGEFNIEDLIEEQEVAITLPIWATSKGARRCVQESKAGRKRVTALTTKTEDFVSDMYYIRTIISCSLPAGQGVPSEGL